MPYWVATWLIVGLVVGTIKVTTEYLESKEIGLYYSWGEVWDAISLVFLWPVWVGALLFFSLATLVVTWDAGN